MTILMILVTKLNCQVKHVMKSIFRGHFWSNKSSSQTHPRRIILKALTKAAYSQCCSSVLYSRKNSKNFVRKKIICIVPNNFSVTFFNKYTWVHGWKSVRISRSGLRRYSYSMFLYNKTGLA